MEKFALDAFVDPKDDNDRAVSALLLEAMARVLVAKDKKLRRYKDAESRAEPLIDAQQAEILERKASEIVYEDGALLEGLPQIRDLAEKKAKLRRAKDGGKRKRMEVSEKLDWYYYTVFRRSVF